MDLSKIKSRLDRLNNPGGGKSSDFKANFWRAPVGEKSQIRLVPYKQEPLYVLYYMIIIYLQDISRMGIKYML